MSQNKKKVRLTLEDLVNGMGVIRHKAGNCEGETELGVKDASEALHCAKCHEIVYFKAGGGTIFADIYRVLFQLQQQEGLEIEFIVQAPL